MLPSKNPKDLQAERSLFVGYWWILGILNSPFLKISKISLFVTKSQVTVVFCPIGSVPNECPRLLKKIKGMSWKTDLILSDSKAKFVGKIHSTTYKTVKAYQGKTSNNNTKQNPDNQNRTENYLEGVYVCMCVSVCV